MTMHPDAERCFAPCSRSATCARPVPGIRFDYRYDLAPQYPGGPDCHGHVEKEKP